MRKLFIVLSVLFILCFSVIPASAVMNGGTALYAPLRFDSFVSGANYEKEDAWNCNIVSRNIEDYYSTSLYTVVPNLGPAGNGFFPVDFEIYPSTVSFRFLGGDQIVDLSYLDSLFFNFGLDGHALGSVSWEFDLMLPRLDGNQYLMDYVHLVGSDVSAEGIYTGARMKDAIENKGVSSYAYIRNLIITVEFEDDTAAGVVYGMYMDYYPMSQLSIATWFDQQGFDHTTVVNTTPGEENFNLVFYLDSILDALFEFQLMPGVTIGGLLSIAVGIGILLLFLKIVQAG